MLPKTYDLLSKSPKDDPCDDWCSHLNASQLSKENFQLIRLLFFQIVAFV